MSLVHYISASCELPLGQFGANKTKSDNKKSKAINIINCEVQEKIIPLENIIDLPDVLKDELEEYETYEDAAGIYISKIKKSSEEIRRQFKNQYICKISPNWGNFVISEEVKKRNEQVYRINKKCITELIAYLQKNINNNEEAELYTCYLGEEGEKRNQELDLVIKLDSFALSDDFCLKEKQYILFTK